MELLESKICAMISLGLGSMLAGLIPACFSNHGRNHWPLFLSSLLCIGGGVLLSTSLVHMLPEIRETLVGYENYAEILFCGGFFLLYLTDEIVHFFKEKPSYSLDDENEKLTTVGVVRRRSFNHKRHRSYGAVDHPYVEYSQRQMPYNPSFSKAWSENDLTYDNPPSQLCHVAHQEPCKVSPVGNLGLLIALSIHALLEGLAVGIEKSTDQVLLMLGAIASHKLVVGFCLGIEIASTSTNTACRHFISIVIFSFGSVLGIGIGMIVYKVPKEISDIALPILQALAGGTLLYVTMCEVLPRERARWHQQHNRKSAGLVQFFSVIVGFLCMTVLIYYLHD